MNPIALLIILAVGITVGWRAAFLLLGGYLLAFLIIGFIRGRRQL
jgi:hypothetical protein